jgi:capsule polysaccharide export protein KpsC/LpsZ
MPHGDESYANSIYDDMGHFAEQQRQSELEKLRAENAALRIQVERQKTALEEIRDHWANQYDHPRKVGPMYAGSYGIGVTDGHRAAAIIATKALTSDDSRG